MLLRCWETRAYNRHADPLRLERGKEGHSHERMVEYPCLDRLLHFLLISEPETMRQTMVPELGAVPGAQLGLVKLRNDWLLSEWRPWEPIQFFRPPSTTHRSRFILCTWLQLKPQHSTQYASRSQGLRDLYTHMAASSTSNVTVNYSAKTVFASSILDPGDQKVYQRYTISPC